MGVILYFLFSSVFLILLLGVYAERVIVNETISQAKGEKIPLAYTQKKRIENLMLYRSIVVEKKESLVYYHFLDVAYKHGMKSVYFVLFLMILSFIF